MRPKFTDRPFGLRPAAPAQGAESASHGATHWQAGSLWQDSEHAGHWHGGPVRPAARGRKGQQRLGCAARRGMLHRARAASSQVLLARTSESEGAASVSSRARQHHRQGPTHPGPAGPDEAPSDGARLRPCACMLAELRLRSCQAKAAWTHSWRTGRDQFGPSSDRNQRALGDGIIWGRGWV